jgi:hypothetical protein
MWKPEETGVNYKMLSYVWCSLWFNTVTNSVKNLLMSSSVYKSCQSSRPSRENSWNNYPSCRKFIFWAFQLLRLAFYLVSSRSKFWPICAKGCVMYILPLNPGCMVRNGAPYSSWKVDTKTTLMSLTSSTLKWRMSYLVWQQSAKTSPRIVL